MDRIDDPKNTSKDPLPETTMSSEKPGLESDIARGDLIELNTVDAVLAAKMHLLNQVRHHDRHTELEY